MEDRNTQSLIETHVYSIGVRVEGGIRVVGPRGRNVTVAKC